VPAFKNLRISADSSSREKKTRASKEKSKSAISSDKHTIMINGYNNYISKLSPTADPEIILEKISGKTLSVVCYGKRIEIDLPWGRTTFEGRPNRQMIVTFPNGIKSTYS
jgi:hypothetical protein